MRRAIELAIASVQTGGGGPFGAVIVHGERIIAEGGNRVTSSNDPTAHAEIVATREACRSLGHFHLTGCDIYTSCEPCPMCLGAIHWAGISRVFFAATRDDAAAAGFGDLSIYKEFDKPLAGRRIPMIPLLRKDALAALHVTANASFPLLEEPCTDDLPAGELAARSVRHEMAQRLPDLLFVSTHLGYERSWDKAALRPFAGAMAPLLDWDSQRVHEEIALALRLCGAPPPGTLGT